jgi:hypothetical protein
VNEDGTEVGVVQIHPDAASMAFHMKVVAELRALPELPAAEITRAGEARIECRCDVE